MKLLGRKNKKFFIFHSSFFIYFVSFDKLGGTSEVKIKRTFFILYFARFALSLSPQKLNLTSVSPIIYL